MFKMPAVVLMILSRHIYY